MTRYEEFIDRKRSEYGDRFDDSDLAPQFVPYFNSRERVRVQFDGLGTSYLLTGRIGVTTGWRPAFLLMRAANHHGSPYLLGKSDQIVAIQHGRKYQAVAR